MFSKYFNLITATFSPLAPPVLPFSTDNSSLHDLRLTPRALHIPPPLTTIRFSTNFHIDITICPLRTARKPAC